MAEATDNQILEHLRHISGAVDILCEDMLLLETRIGRLEIDLRQMQLASAEQSTRFDRLVARVARLEKHLDLPET